MTSPRMDKMDRRGALQCLGWAGTGALYTLAGGTFTATALDAAIAAPYGKHAPKVKPLTFLQISDTHVGFNKPANPDTRGTFKEAVARIKALTVKPDFILHTGDISHLSKPEEFADADDILSEAGLPVFHVPGEHDTLDEGNGKLYLDRYGKDTLGNGWYSFDHSGVHFIALINVVGLAGSTMGHLGADQIAWLKKDLAPLSSSTPIVVFSHIPMWTIAADWGWGTDDSTQALAMLARFGSVTVLNGHVHQIFNKVEGNMRFFTARSTAYPQPAPGTAPSPGPLKVPAEQLPSVLGIRTATIQAANQPIALVEQTLA